MGAGFALALSQDFSSNRDIPAKIVTASKIAHAKVAFSFGLFGKHISFFFVCPSVFDTFDSEFSPFDTSIYDTEI